MNPTLTRHPGRPTPGAGRLARGSAGVAGTDPACALVEALGAATEVVRARVRARASRDNPAVVRAPATAFDAAFDLQYERILDAMQSATSRSLGRKPPDPSPTWAQSGGLRDVPDVMLPVCDAAVKEAIDCVREIGERMGSDPDTVLDVVTAVAHATGTAFLAMGSPVHAGSGWEGAWDELRARSARTLLLGGATRAEIRAEATVLGIDTEQVYVAFRARPAAGFGPDALARELLAAESNGGRDGLAATVDGDLIGFLAAPPSQPGAGVVGVGPARKPDRLAESFQLATRALDAAHAFGLTGAHSFDSLGLLPTIVADADVGESLQRRYLQPRAGASSLPDLLSTLRAYFACGMNVERAARELALHPNTLRNRISRFETSTGANLADPAVAMEVWWALQHGALTDAAADPRRPAALPPPECGAAGSHRRPVLSTHRNAGPDQSPAWAARDDAPGPREGLARRAGQGGDLAGRNAPLPAMT
jgi:hypothetical protein